MHKPILLAALLFVSTPTALALPASASTTVVVDRVDDLIEEGRDLLSKNRHEDAKERFDEAAELPGGKDRAAIWKLRVAMHLESLNDVLGRIDALADERDDAGIDYLYGMAFAVKAQQALDAGLNDGTIGMQMTDSQAFLERAVKAEGARYPDAYVMLTHVAYMNSDFDAALAAGDKAVGHYPKSATAWGRRGRVQVQRFIALQAAAGDDETAYMAAIEVADDALSSLDKAIELIGTRTDDGRVTERAELHEQVALTHAFLANPKEMEAAYAHAMAWDPSILDFGQLWGTLGAGFVRSLEAGKEEFEGRWGTDSKADATLLWYLGYARYQALQGGEREFEEAAIPEFEMAAAELKAAVEKWPAYANGLWYAGLSEYATGDFEGAADTFIDFWQLDPAGAVATFDADQARSWPRVEYVIGQLVDPAGLRTRADVEKLRKAATLAELCANTLKPAGLHWSYQGLFMRDYGDVQLRNRMLEAGSEELVAIYEESVTAYERALKLEPDNPNFMNDLAVVLHYNLDRDLERALELYTEAEKIAAEMMADPSVDEQRKQDFISIALRDAGNNRRLLENQLEEAKKGDEEAPEDGDK